MLGEHGGLARYTIGQRKGLGVASDEPLYVLGKDASNNCLLVGEAEELGTQELIANEVNWISGMARAAPFRASVKIRYTAREAPAEVMPIAGGRQVKVRFDVPQRDITAGQAAVFYEDEAVVGGGIIQ